MDYEKIPDFPVEFLCNFVGCTGISLWLHPLFPGSEKAFTGSTFLYPAGQGVESVLLFYSLTHNKLPKADDYKYPYIIFINKLYYKI